MSRGIVDGYSWAKRTHLVAKQCTASPGDGETHSLPLKGCQSTLQAGGHARVPPCHLCVRLRVLLGCHSPANVTRSTFQHKLA